MEQPVICVIVPVYKAEATLPRCIESVLTQQLPGGLRLILVDDQSPDRSGEICDAYAAKDPRVMVLHRRERGVSGARNAGLRAATGEYIVFLDSDDALRPGASAAAIAAQAAAPNAFVLCHYTMQPDAACGGFITQRIGTNKYFAHAELLRVGHTRPQA